MKSIPVRQISTPDASASHEGLKIRTLQSLLDGHDLRHSLHRHNYYFILFIEDAKGVHEIDFISYQLGKHSVFLLKPGQVHQLMIKKGGTGYILQFSNEWINDLNALQLQMLRSVFHRSFYTPGKTEYGAMKILFALMLEEFSRKQQLYADIIKSHLLTVVLHLFRSGTGKRVPSGPNAYSQHKLEALQELLEKNIVRYKKPADYAAMLNLSAFQLNSITKSLLGKNCSQVIHEFIILEAKRLLLATTSQVNAIADELGFDDPAYFIRFFRKHTGLTPEALRKTSG